MRIVTALVAVLITGCTTSNESALTELATRLADGNHHSGWPIGLREAYISCGKAALAHVPAATLERANRAADSATIWAILGTDTLDQYVATCRKAEHTVTGVKR